MRTTPLPFNEKGKRRQSSPFPFRKGTGASFERKAGLQYQPRALRTILIDGVPDSFDPEDIVGCFHPLVINEIQSRRTTLNAPVQSLQIEFRDPDTAKKALLSPPFQTKSSDITPNRIIYNQLDPLFGRLWSRRDQGGDLHETPLLLWFWRNGTTEIENDLTQYVEMHHSSC